MSLSLLIAAADKTDDIRVTRPIKISDDLNSRNVLTFALKENAGVYRPDVGAVVELSDGGVLKFAGTVDDYDEAEVGGDVLYLHEHAVRVVDYTQLCDKRRVAQTYETPGQTVGDIVSAIVTEFMADDGITTTNVETGRVVVKAVFPYVTVTQAFDELAKLAGMSWYVDENKDLHFFTRSTNAAPFGLTATSKNFRNLKVNRNRDKYYNTLYVRAGTALADARTESFIGDGALRTYLLSLPCAKEPAVTVNAAAKTVGIYQLETGYDYYWNKGKNEIVQDAGGTVLQSTDTLAVTYEGSYPLMTVGVDGDEVTARAAVEGGSGVYAEVIDAPYIDDEDMAIDLQKSLLTIHSVIPHYITFETDTSGLKAGQLISINVPVFGISGTYLIETVKSSFVRGRDVWVHQVKALSGENLGGWVSFFRQLELAATAFVIRENEVILLLRFVSDGVACADAVSAASAAPETRADYALADFGEVGT